MTEQILFPSRYLTGALGARARSIWSAVRDNNLAKAHEILKEISSPDISVQFINSVGINDEASCTDIPFEREENTILARARSRPMVVLLVQTGADPFARNRLGEEPDVTAMRYGEGMAAAEIKRQKAWIQEIRASECLTRIRLGLPIDLPQAGF